MAGTRFEDRRLLKLLSYDCPLPLPSLPRTGPVRSEPARQEYKNRYTVTVFWEYKNRYTVTVFSSRGLRGAWPVSRLRAMRWCCWGTKRCTATVKGSAG